MENLWSICPLGNTSCVFSRFPETWVLSGREGLVTLCHFTKGQVIFSLFYRQDFLV